MKKKILLLIGMFSVGLMNAQIAINTDKPLGIFHVDGKGDTFSTGSTIDDVIVDSDGNLSIGAGDTPLAKLHIKSEVAGKGLRLYNGINTNNFYYVATDALGNAEWKESYSDIGIITFEMRNPSGYLTNNTVFQASALTNVFFDTYNTPASNYTSSINGITLPAGNYACYINGNIPDVEFYMGVYFVYGANKVQFNAVHSFLGNVAFALATPTKVYLQAGPSAFVASGVSGNNTQFHVVHGQVNSPANYNYWIKFTILKFP